MFLLTFNCYEDRDVKGVFTTVKKAQHYVETVMRSKDLKWSDPTHRIDGAVWVNYAGGSLSIDPVPVNPTE